MRFKLKKYFIIPTLIVSLLITDTTYASNKKLTFYSSSQRAKVVQVALNQIGTKEKGGNTNIIKYNNWYVKDHSWLSKTSPYCAIFTLWCFNKVGMYKKSAYGPPTIDSASCIDSANKYMDYGRFIYSDSKYTPRAGDIIYFTKWSKSNTRVKYHSHHTGLIVKVDDNYIYTVEGNTSIPQTELESAGNGVYTKKYKLPSKDKSTRVLGYAVPWYSGEEEFYSPDGYL